METIEVKCLFPDCKWDGQHPEYGKLSYANQVAKDHSWHTGHKVQVIHILIREFDPEEEK